MSKLSKLMTEINRITCAFDGTDLWGSTLTLHFDICEVLDASDIEGDVTPEPFDRWQYRRSPVTTVPSLEALASDEFEDNDDRSFGATMLAAELLRGTITQRDLIYVGDVLSKYAVLLRANGHDY